MRAGYLKIYVGPMFSKKSTKISAELTTFADLGKKCLFVNHIIDERKESLSTVDDGFISLHSSSSFQLSPLIDKIKVECLSDIDVKSYDVIAIDECQFFSDLVETVCDWVDEQGKTVLCGGLDGDANRDIFGQTLFLIPHADKVIKLRAKCLRCLQENQAPLPIVNKAPFTIRTVKQSGGNILVGGSEYYAPVCRFHYQKSQTTDS
jgi:thymidine kinase